MFKYLQVRRNRIRFLLLLLLTGIIIFLAFPLKKPLFKDDYSTVIFDKDGRWIQGEIAEDEQWRFPPGDVSEKFSIALIHFEDKKFYHHLGVRPGSLARAMVQNIQAGQIVSGGSTITMQAVRLSRNRERNYRQKFLEMVIALRWELHLKKDEILQLYAAHAPFGSNIVGLEAASYRYFGVSPQQLSWGESALLAVLPNAPSLMYPGKNTKSLKTKRDKLLTDLYNEGYIEENTLYLAIDEPLPTSVYPPPRETEHLLLRAHSEGKKGMRVNTTIDLTLQREASHILENHHRRLKNNQIENGSCIILETQTGKVLAYVGNTKSGKDEPHNNQVDNISASRSTGSLLKPFLYASMLTDGLLLPDQLIPDCPLDYQGFRPENYTHDFRGMVTASEALIYSLNVPMVHLLAEYGIEPFFDKLKTMNLTLPYESGHYGLTLIVGGAETGMWELTSLYAGMARTLISYNSNKNYYKESYHKNVWLQKLEEETNTIQEYPPLHAGAIWKTFMVMKELNRPDEEGSWKFYDSSNTMAWKTGTSWGNRDAWAIGVTPEYVIGVWIGNSSGEGRPGNTGSQSAAPFLFDLVDILPDTSWFKTPYSDLEEVELCADSHMLKGPYCEESYIDKVPRSKRIYSTCIYHKRIYLDQDERYRVGSTDYPVNLMVHKNWFILPPVEEWYYRYFHSDYKKLPPLMPGTQQPDSTEQIGWIYPKSGSKIHIPIEIDGSSGKVLLQAAHRDREASIYWFIDGEYLQTTKNFHQIEISPPPGQHRALITDNLGRQKVCIFTVE